MSKRAAAKTAGSKWHAEVARGLFVKRKRSLLRAAANEQKTPREVLALLEKAYEKQTRVYLRADGTTYAEWLEHGPLAELEEVRAAVRVNSVWDRLVDRAVAA